MNRERFVKTVASLVILITLSAFISYANSTRDNYHDRVATGTSSKSTDIKERKALPGIS